MAIYTLIISRAEWRANEKGIMQLSHSSGYRWSTVGWHRKLDFLRRFRACGWR